ncbi:MAG: class II aldolase/adducin family protein [Mycobacterium sp.]
MILGNHGRITVGGSPDAAAWRFIAMERSCQAQLLAKTAGKVISTTTTRSVRVNRSAVTRGWLNFQPL